MAVAIVIASLSIPAVAGAASPHIAASPRTRAGRALGRAHAKKSLCPPSFKRKHGRCYPPPVKAHGTAPAAAEQSTFAFALAANKKLPKLSPRHRSKVPAALRTGLPSLLTNSTASTVASRSEARVSARTSRLASAADADTDAGGLAGWNISVTGKGSDDPSMIGEQDAQATATASVQKVADGARLAAQIQFGERERELVDRCPLADGTVPGNGLQQFSLSLGAADGKSDVSVTATINQQMTYTGHVDDTGKLQDFDVKLHVTMLVEGGERGTDGKLYSQDPPRLYVLDLNVDGLNPDNPYLDQLGDWHLGGAMTYHMILGHMSWDDDFAPKVLELAQELFTMNVDTIAHAYKDAEANWQTPGRCVKVALSTPSTSVQGNASVPVTATISGLWQASKGLSNGKYTASASAGTLNQTSGAYSSEPVQLTYTAPAQGGPTITVTTQSRQGKGLDTLQLHVASKYELVYTHSSHLDYDGTPEMVAEAPQSGTEDRHEAYSLTSTIPLTGSPATGLTGIGPLSFTNAKYHLDFDGSWASNGGATCTGSWTTDVTGTTPGEADVVGLTFTSAADVKLSFSPGQRPGGSSPLPNAPSENYHQVQTYNACPGATSDTTTYTWNSYFATFYARAGMLLGLYGSADIDSGWQAGSGNVVATRTVNGNFPLSSAMTPSTSNWTDTYQIVRV